MDSNQALVETVRTNPYLLRIKKPRDERVLQAMLVVDRKNFVRPEHQNYAYLDMAVPIGYDATCSQPSTVAFMSDLLLLKPGMKVLEIGTGCGYHAAIIYELIKGQDKQGQVGELTTIEFVEKLAPMGEDNLERQHGLDAKIECLIGDGSEGIQFEQFDRIYFTGSVNINTFNRQILLDQLRPPGILMFPESSLGALCVFYKSKLWVRPKKFHQFQFVELQGKNK